VLVPVVVPVDVPVDVPVVVPVDVPVLVPVVVPVVVFVDVPVDVPVDVFVDVPVVVFVDVPVDVPEVPDVVPLLLHLTLKTFCFSPPEVGGEVCFTSSLYCPSGKGCGVGQASNCQSLLLSPRASAFHVPWL
jgi:hypothetical protein